MRLLGDRLLLAPLPPREQSTGGIILPQEQVGDLKMYWKVSAAGPDVGPDIQTGDTVITALHFSHHNLEDGTGRKIVDSDQVIGKLEETPFVLPDI